MNKDYFRNKIEKRDIPGHFLFNLWYSLPKWHGLNKSRVKLCKVWGVLGIELEHPKIWLQKTTICYPKYMPLVYWLLTRSETVDTEIALKNIYCRKQMKSGLNVSLFTWGWPYEGHLPKTNGNSNAFSGWGSEGCWRLPLMQVQMLIVFAENVHLSYVPLEVYDLKTAPLQNSHTEISQTCLLVQLYIRILLPCLSVIN